MTDYKVKIGITEYREIEEIVTINDNDFNRWSEGQADLAEYLRAGNYDEFSPETKYAFYNSEGFLILDVAPVTS